ncbi:MAG: hypothetical protein EP349_04805 [Alphaproteobacteria bacterium]|nr:MAG: hypothetical protein EP349_04805 [Alphaproteobacteria bacterium]
MPHKITRRRFNKGLLGLVGAAGLTGVWMPPRHALAQSGAAVKKQYKGPHVIIIRYGGGVRRRETVDPQYSWSPYMMKVLAKKGFLYSNMELAQLEDSPTSHAQGTINILTGRYRAYHDLRRKGFGEVLEPTSPTLFEYFRQQYDIPVHQALIINSENRLEDETINFARQSMDQHMYGVEYRSEFLSYNKFKLYKIREQLKEGNLSDKEAEEAQKEIEKIKNKMMGAHLNIDRYPDEIEKFWAKWRAFYGDSGLQNPRGDRLTTELSLWALRELRPKLMMINYQDVDYVHWGIKSQYTRGIAIIDRGIREIVEEVERDEEYRDNTVFAIVPDCGRDSNPLLRIPYQHHFNTRSSHEIFAMFYGTGIQKNMQTNKVVDQSSMAATIGTIMGVKTPQASGHVLEDIFI